MMLSIMIVLAICINYKINITKDNICIKPTERLNKDTNSMVHIALDLDLYNHALN